MDTLRNFASSVEDVLDGMTFGQRLMIYGMVTMFVVIVFVGGF